MKTKLFFLFFLCSILIGLTGYAENHVPSVFTGKPAINPPYVVGNYPSTPFLHYIPTSGQRPVKWSAHGLPKGLKLDETTGIISGSVATKGEYTVTLKAQNALGTDVQKLVINIGDNLLLTPPMGWNSWNTFGRHLTEDLILQTADAMIATGMRDLGYSYINIDDFWQLAERGADGHIQIDKTKFPRGIKYISDYLHERGFKLGIYSDAADRTCGGVCGSYGYEEVDACDFASWGIDLLKYDYCNAPHGRIEAFERYSKMGSALRATNRSIVFSVCEWGQRQPWKWAKKTGGHLWRISGDIGDLWEQPSTRKREGLRGILNIIEINAPLEGYAGPGSWNDPDMLVVGIRGKSASIGFESQGCTDEQYKSHFALWCMMASPLLCGNDLRNMDDSTLQILTNEKLIAINQDKLGKQAERVIRADRYDIWVKPLSDGTKVVACLNLSDKPITVELNGKSIEGISLNKYSNVTEQNDIVRNQEGLLVKLVPYQCSVFVCEK